MLRSWLSGLGLGLGIGLTIAVFFRTQLRQMQQEEVHYQHILREANARFDEEWQAEWDMMPTEKRIRLALRAAELGVDLDGKS